MNRTRALLAAWHVNFVQFSGLGLFSFGFWSLAHWLGYVVAGLCVCLVGYALESD